MAFERRSSSHRVIATVGAIVYGTGVVYAVRVPLYLELPRSSVTNSKRRIRGRSTAAYSARPSVRVGPPMRVHACRSPAAKTITRPRVCDSKKKKFDI
ncbi:unnamed protein product, partial [Iphiclides podalirius]